MPCKFNHLCLNYSINHADLYTVGESNFFLFICLKLSPPPNPHSPSPFQWTEVPRSETQLSQAISMYSQIRGMWKLLAHRDMLPLWLSIPGSLMQFLSTHSSWYKEPSPLLSLLLTHPSELDPHPIHSKDIPKKLLNGVFCLRERHFNFASDFYSPFVLVFLLLRPFSVFQRWKDIVTKWQRNYSLSLASGWVEDPCYVAMVFRSASCWWLSGSPSILSLSSAFWTTPLVSHPNCNGLIISPLYLNRTIGCRSSKQLQVHLNRVK